LLTDLDLANAAFAAVTAGISPKQMTAPTPCTNINVRALVEHLVEGSSYFASLIAGRQEPVAVDQTEDLVSALRAAAAAMRGAFAVPGVLGETFDSPIGAASGAFFAKVRIIELVAHGWDLARATGQSMDIFSDDLCERALAMAHEVYADRTRGRFADEQSVPEGAPAVDKLAAFLGRTP
jgi:uncharacterized protein (TIGR03086 family)